MGVSMAELQTDQEKRPTRLGMTEVLNRASLLCRWLEESGMTDRSSSDFKISEELVGKCASTLKVTRDSLRLYLVNLGGLSTQLRGPIFRAAMRMASQKEQFRLGLCPTASSPETSPKHWAGAYLLDCSHRFDQVTSKNKADMRFLIATGPLAGKVLESSFPKNFFFIMCSEIGAVVRNISRSIDVFYGPNELKYANLCQTAIFLQSRREMYVSKVSATSSMMTYNRKLVRSRLRALSPCPFNRHIDCAKCNATTLQCSRALWVG